MSTPQNPRRILNEIRASAPPESGEDVRERLNLIEQLVALLSPDDEFEEAILEAILEQNRLLEQMGTSTTEQVAGVSVLNLPENSTDLLQQLNVRMEEVVRGTVETQALPVGLTGTATTGIENGETGVGLFRFSGGRYAAEVTADEAIDQFDNIRIKDPENNLVTPISAEQEVGEVEAPINRAQAYDVTLNAGANILDDDIRPSTRGSTLRVTVTIDATTTEFAARVIPDADAVADFNTFFLEGAALEAGARFEFEFDANPDAQYNFRCPNDAVTIRQIRVQETLVV